MKFGLNDEQLDLQRTVRRYLQSTWGDTGLRAYLDGDAGALDTATQGLVSELGLGALAAEAPLGQEGVTWVELVVVLEELGRALLAGTFTTSTVLSAQLLSGGGGDGQALVAKIADGSMTAAVIVGRGLQVTSTDGSAVVSGTARSVVNAAAADGFVVEATAADGVGLFCVDNDERWAFVTPQQSGDPTREVVDITFTDAPATSIFAENEYRNAKPIVDQAISLALAADQVGVAERCLNQATEYARTRQQFGRPIGSFQAIKHRCADMLVRAHTARTLLRYAAWVSVHGQQAEAERLVAAAMLHADDAAVRNAADNIQIHGGIGFTWEHDAHLAFKRAHATRQMFGGPNRSRRTVMACVR
jgi:alkylation response protein AidB-like acyl-CoA dehydrogenase